jgi:nucleoside-diphosphate-sugar epimerase
MFKTAVITGATGWIGSTFESYLKENFPNVTACKANRNMELSSKIEGEVALFHFAFPTKDKTSGMSLEEYKSSVLTLRGKVVDLIEKIKPTKMVYVSSGAVFKLGTSKFVETLEEDPYGFLKLEEEKIFSEIASQKGIKLLIPRIFALAGGFVNKHELYLLPNFILQAKKTGKIQINAKGRVFRSFIHIFDLFEICLKYFESNLESPYIFETSGEKVLELNDVAFYIAKTLDLKIQISREFYPNIPENNYYAQNNSCILLLDKLKIKTPRHLEDCILDTYKFLH